MHCDMSYMNVCDMYNMLYSSASKLKTVHMTLKDFGCFWFELISVLLCKKRWSQSVLVELSPHLFY
jgi:hypothetical protein